MTGKKNIFFWVPNTITAMNLLSGVIATIIAVKGEIGLAALLIIIASVFDFLDGMAARLLHSYSEIGKQLDSLADAVSFGVAPASIMINMAGNTDSMINIYIVYAVILLIPVAGVFRLAKFNIDTRQSESFLGLPIPANAIFFASLALVVVHGGFQGVNSLITNHFFMMAAAIIFSWLMISEIPMFSLKVKHLKWEGNQLRVIFIALCLVLFITLKLYALPFIIIFYILLSVLNGFAQKSQ